jgi:mannose-6-phosphate isomerase-like protein (cupin superfamily)
MSTSGHSHKGQEEVYYFVSGSGRMELDDKTINVKENDVVLIEDGVFHRVHAGPHGIYFVCVFDGRRSH